MALKKEIIDEYGQRTDYHRIAKIECDYNQKQLHIYLESYTSEDYRNLEKQDEELIIKEAKKIKRKKLDEETRRKLMKEIESKEIQPRMLKTYKYTLPFKDIFRKKIYKRIMEEINDFKEAEGV